MFFQFIIGTILKTKSLFQFLYMFGYEFKNWMINNLIKTMLFNSFFNIIIHDWIDSNTLNPFDIIPSLFT